MHNLSSYLFPTHESIRIYILFAIERREYMLLLIPFQFPRVSIFYKWKIAFWNHMENMIFRKKMQFPMKNMALLSFQLIKFLRDWRKIIKIKLFNLDELQSFALWSSWSMNHWWAICDNVETLPIHFMSHFFNLI